MNKKIKIATILPYKENYTFSRASAASLWVSEFFKKSKFKKDNIILGSTNFKDYLSTNYINISLKTIDSKFKSSTNEYIQKLEKIIDRENFDIIEIHNRPIILNSLIKKSNKKFIFYFHNDPLSMNGSKNKSERLDILKKVNKIIFVSRWTQKRFFIDIDEKLINKTEVIYPSVSVPKTIKKKINLITFVGRLNESKGYDLFKQSIVKILDNYPLWKSISIGDEERRKIFIKHKSHSELGFITHKKVLEFLDKSEITVIPSKWEEPFGRTALEASSRGSATIITNRGGLTETTDHAIVLKKITHNALYKEIKKLITNKIERKKIQNLSSKNIKHLISKNTKLIDDIRERSVANFAINILKKKIKIVNIYNQGQKLDHRLYNISLGKKFTNGFIRNNNDVLEISDRDYIKQNRSFSFNPSNNSFQKYLINSCKSYNPDLLFFGHTKNINLETLDILKNLNKNLVISQWNEDPVMQNLDYSKKNINNIEFYSEFVDHTFLTTHPDVLKKNSIKLKNNNNIHFLFVPVDKNIECYDVFKLKPKNDLFYAMSHGVNRAKLKTGKIDDRIIFLNKLVKKIKDIKYDFYGFENQQPIWGNDFFNSLINSKMGLNLSRGNPTKYYSSNRIASIMGNGLLTFIDSNVEMNDFFNNDEIIFYDNINDLKEKINFYANNDKERIRIAKNGKDKYFKLFNETKITKYIVEKSFGKNSNIIKI